MKTYKHLYGPIPSRRLGRSLGISVTEEKTCNFNCIYCQVGKTLHHLERPKPLLDVDAALDELATAIDSSSPFDVVSIVGNGEPTLESRLDVLIDGIKCLTDKPVALITNGSLFHIDSVCESASKADIVLPSLNGYDERTFKSIHRPVNNLTFERVLEGLRAFCRTYEGQTWLEIMFIEGLNDDDESLEAYHALLETIDFDRLFLNTVVRPPAKSDVNPVSAERMLQIADRLKGVAIHTLADGAFASAIEDDYDALLSLIRHHPMHQHEIDAFLASRDADATALYERLAADPGVESVDYKGFIIYRLV